MVVGVAKTLSKSDFPVAPGSIEYRVHYTLQFLIPSLFQNMNETRDDSHLSCSHSEDPDIQDLYFCHNQNLDSLKSLGLDTPLREMKVSQFSQTQQSAVS